VSAFSQRGFWRRLRLAVLALLGLNGLVLAAYTLPRTLQVRSATSRAEKVRKELAREREATAVLRRQAEAIRGNTAEASRFYSEFVVGSRAELIPLLEDIDRMATEPGLKPSARTYKLEEVKGADLTRVEVLLAVEGSYHQLVGFLDRVERSKHFLTVDRIGLTAGLTAGSPSLKVELSAYLLGKPAKEGPERRRG
jgi:Tfp pilus assembly protein PilO